MPYKEVWDYNRTDGIICRQSFLLLPGRKKCSRLYWPIQQPLIERSSSLRLRIQKGEVALKKGRIYSIAISPERGQLKTEVQQAVVIENYGIENDGHGGDWGRQITCLDKASTDRANKEYGLAVGPGGFAENILLEGLDLTEVKAGSRIKLADEVVLEVTQIGKEDHPSVVTRTYGVSLLPAEGLFCRVIKGGKIKKGDSAEIVAGE